MKAIKGATGARPGGAVRTLNPKADAAPSLAWYHWVPFMTVLDVVAVLVLVPIRDNCGTDSCVRTSSSIFLSYFLASYVALLFEYGLSFYRLATNRVTGGLALNALWQLVWMRQRERLVVGAIFYCMWFVDAPSLFWSGMLAPPLSVNLGDQWAAFVEFHSTATSVLSGVGYGAVIPAHWSIYLLVNIVLTMTDLYWFMSGGFVLAVIYETYRTRRKALSKSQ